MRKKILKLRDEHIGNINHNSSLRIPYFVFTISLFVTLAITYFFFVSAKRTNQNRFASDVVKIQSTIENRFDTNVALLRAGRGFFSSLEDINAKKFSQFVGNLNLRKNYPGVQAIGYSKVFKAEEKESLEKKIRSEGFEEFTIKNFNTDTENPRESYQSIIYIEPFDERNSRAFGFDMSSEPIRRLALETARDTGVYAVSGKVTLLQDETTEQPGFLVYVPNYRGGKIPDNIEDRQKLIDGFVYSPFRAETFINDVVAHSKVDEIGFKIYDAEIDEKNLLAVGNGNEKQITSDLKETKELIIGGRKWIISYTPLEKFNNQSLTWWTPIIFLTGLITSIILFFLSLAQSRANIKLARTAQKLAESQTEVQTLFESERKAREAAEKSNKVKGDFISVVSHELRTPLNAISGWVQVLKTDSLNIDIKLKAIETINKNLRAQVNLVEDMIDFSDSAFLQTHDKWQQISFKTILEDCLNQANDKIISQKLNLTQELIDEDLLILCDRQKVHKAVSYLLDNAIKFTPQNGSITLKLIRNKDCLDLQIIDTGEGISSEILPNIFNLFDQVDSTITRKHGGLGVGLAIAKKIIKGHQGDITAASEGIGKGSTFTVNLPVVKH